MSSRRFPARPRLALALAASTLALAGCGLSGSDEDDKAPEADASFAPVTIEHAFGSTEIDARPQRIVALGWGSADAAIAMGVVPVGIEAQSYGANENGLMPWVEDAVNELDADLPTTLTSGESPAFREINRLDPDLILATYSGITEADYEKLEEIAPTVAYPDQPWSTPWRDVITTTGEALGEPEKAEKVLDDIDAEVADAAQAHPEFAGTSIAAVAIDPSAFYVYTEADPRVQFLEDLGFTVAPSVTKLAGDETGFYYTLDPSVIDGLTSDVLLSYEGTDEQHQAIADDDTYQVMSQFKDGHVASVIGEANVSSVSPPTALSLTYSLDTFVDALAGAIG